MDKKCILQLGALLLLVQLAAVMCSYSQLDTFSLDYEMTSSEEVMVNPLVSVLFFSMEKFFKVTIHDVEANKKLFEAVIRDGSASKNRQLQAHLSKLADFVEKANQLKDISNSLGKLFDLVIDIDTLHDQFDSENLENPPQDILLMEQLLEKYGIEEVKLKSSKRLMRFFESFTKKLDEAVSLLTAEQNSTEFQNWYQSFTTENDMEEKLELFTKFFDFFLNDEE